MLKKDAIPDRSIDQKVCQQLANRGMRPPCKVTASSKGGTVTLTGKIQYEHQRNVCIQVVKRVDGVKRVVDQLQVLVKVVKKETPVDQGSSSGIARTMSSTNNGT
jgi:osmotically-inducible protein OsmY